jgi:hypothetical protein
MSNRLFKSKLQAPIKETKVLSFQFFPTGVATGALPVIGGGVQQVNRTATGTYQIELQNQYYELLSAQASYGQNGAPTGTVGPFVAQWGPTNVTQTPVGPTPTASAQTLTLYAINAISGVANDMGGLVATGISGVVANVQLTVKNVK